MAFEADHHAAEAREWAEDRFTPEQVAAAKPIMDAFEFKILDIDLRSLESSLAYYDKRTTKTERAIGKVEFDLGPDGSEIVPQGRDCSS